VDGNNTNSIILRNFKQRFSHSKEVIIYYYTNKKTCHLEASVLCRHIFSLYVLIRIVHNTIDIDDGGLYRGENDSDIIV